MTNNLILEENKVVEFTNRTSAYAYLPKHMFFHNVPKNDDIKIKRKITFAGTFSDFAGRYVVESVNNSNGVCTYHCAKLEDTNVKIEYVVDTNKPMFVKPYKIVGQAKKVWEIIENY
jgi:hypothetical protein